MPHNRRTCLICAQGEERCPQLTSDGHQVLSGGLGRSRLRMQRWSELSDGDRQSARPCCARITLGLGGGAQFAAPAPATYASERGRARARAPVARWGSRSAHATPRSGHARRREKMPLTTVETAQPHPYLLMHAALAAQPRQLLSTARRPTCAPELAELTADPMASCHKARRTAVRSSNPAVASSGDVQLLSKSCPGNKIWPRFDQDYPRLASTGQKLAEHRH